ncbi:hypothetical protein J8I29_17370 [Labrys sp. LIt4]|uniref:Uncharacterized protein n=1 Tax=Labrys okinawensis TaxID=346911 RepID=A0A2S9QIP3_9HYPH|nr:MULTISPECIES: hypothetical protein [Labrys]MBP0581100.1 hypothetical protein [Labrys sp. LIt4]PRH89160.1 hypothetical protein C5L14_00775 [Labrys okinawensis]
MKPIFCSFERSFDRHQIEVNVNLVLYLEGNDDGTTTMYFAKDEFVVVRGNLAETRGHIETCASITPPADVAA